MKREVVAFIYGDNFNDLSPLSKQESKRALSDFDKGSKVFVSIRPYRRERTLSQNDIFHAICGSISEHSGHTPREVKKRMKEEFGIWVPRTDRSGRLIYDEKGRLIYKPKNTSDYDTMEMAELIDKVSAFSSEFLNNKQPEINFFKQINIEL